MPVRHVIVYVPGLGDTRASGRKLALHFWRLYGVRGVVHQMVWADGQPYAPKFQGLLEHIDAFVDKGCRVSLVGESAGASAALNAYAARRPHIHRVIFICGKLANPGTIHSVTYERNPAFKEAMATIPASLAKLSAEDRRRMRSLSPLRDRVVPPPDTRIDGADHKTLPSTGHAFSISLSITLFSWWLVRYLERP